MASLRQRLLKRLENSADTIGIDGLMVDLLNFALRWHWAEVQPEDLLTFLFHDRWSYRPRALIKAYSIDRSVLRPVRRSATPVGRATLSPACIRMLNGAVAFASANGRTPQQLRYSDVLMVFCILESTAPLIHTVGLTRLKITYFLSHRSVLPEEPIEPTWSKLRIRKQVRVRVHNDDFTPMDVVTRILNTVFELDEAKSKVIMLKVHEEGETLLGPFEPEVARNLIERATAMAREAESPLLVTLGL